MWKQKNIAQILSVHKDTEIVISTCFCNLLESLTWEYHRSLLGMF